MKTQPEEHYSSSRLDSSASPSSLALGFNLHLSGEWQAGQSWAEFKYLLT